MGIDIPSAFFSMKLNNVQIIIKLKYYSFILPDKIRENQAVEDGETKCLMALDGDGYRILNIFE